MNRNNWCGKLGHLGTYLSLYRAFNLQWEVDLQEVPRERLYVYTPPAINLLLFCLDEIRDEVGIYPDK